MPSTPRRRFVPAPNPEAEQVCSLDKEGASRRKVPSDILFEEARSQSTSGNEAEFRFESKPGLWERISTFVDEEADCCPFFSFEQREEGGELVLRIIRPETQE